MDLIIVYKLSIDFIFLGFLLPLAFFNSAMVLPPPRVSKQLYSVYNNPAIIWLQLMGLFSWIMPVIFGAFGSVNWFVQMFPDPIYASLIYSNAFFFNHATLSLLMCLSIDTILLATSFLCSDAWPPRGELQIAEGD